MKVKIGQKGSNLFFYIPVEISKSLDLNKGDEMNVNLVGGRGIFSKICDNYKDTNLSVSFHDAISFPHTICSSYICRIENSDHRFVSLHEGDKTIHDFMGGKDEGFCMYHCESRLEGIILRDAFRCNGFDSMLIYEEPPIDELGSWKLEPIVLSNMSYDDYRNYIEYHNDLKLKNHPSE